MKNKLIYKKREEINNNYYYNSKDYKKYEI